ncbi:TPA: hypothetical protein DEQ22_01425 [Candidatus Nomurabacteria bacterium]|uniref:Uncharacterized protein n=1 Tax=Candidatus Nomurabacteria bacterium RIFOXYA2_FULL_42_12 TaxID=1801801 RepID=A0A1F6YMG4_9BACT|nr:MAG: hypothetical protein A2740_00170 [Candidatus Nomurabacteria bacterium RIFCSPHIGHO2_01_FULL_43_16]OGJ04777.1 MAG: hypothetical protein A2357_02575 [Candidatus Nomurabacteria bacterium RIFOXYB1_FULL_43_14]OGJ07554.1 MAG: hypothetical protein A2225_02580 [Candidatus Nomurabacteria bacterium RIFOXYA2_FULL_42_12]OGJ10447.1 MAG: hypothetical protein A2443_01470 [Candidatus Nomurabacteria bacterium RIFOXYC2_FULL_43_16]OGJ12260.1 MAG: hypothetical protein A2432_00525 [Candidatus Nomurabacteria 
MQSETKTCQNCKKDFIIEPDDFGFYEKMKVPTPTFCPECRIKRRLNWQGYRIFYKRMNLLLPHLCSNCRHFQRNKFRNPLKLWHRQCMCDKEHAHHKGRCDIKFETSYASNRPEIVYYEKYYQQEVY